MSSASSPAIEPMEKVRRQLVAHGGLYRAPIIRDTLGQAELRGRFPPRPPEASWPMARVDAEQVVGALEAAGYHTGNSEQRKVRRSGVKTVLSWLVDQPGESWQQRWKASGAELVTGTQWVRTPMAWHAAHGRPHPNVRTLIHHGVQARNYCSIDDRGRLKDEETGASRIARIAVVKANNLATKEHPFGDSIIAYRRSPF